MYISLLESINYGGLNSNNINSGKDYINDILSKCYDGLMVLNYYKLNNNLNYTMRNLLTSVIIKYELVNQEDKQISKSKFIYLAKGKL